MNPFPEMLITIDGPAGAGKTTVSKMLAGNLGYRYLDTGALYRAVAYAVQRAGVSVDDAEGLAAVCRNVRSELDKDRLFLNDEDITDHLRSPEITMLASEASACAVVRRTLLGLQREIGAAGAIVAEGRDMGTVVFPDAPLKFFLDASSHQRALRRFAQYGENSEQSLEKIEKEILQRDQNDSNRDLAPLKPADDAVIIDSTTATAQQVVDRMMICFKALTGRGER